MMRSGRRVAVAVLGVLLALPFLRVELATALVMRGDQQWERGNLGGAMTSYLRSWSLDGSALDVDRLAIMALAQRRQRALSAVLALEDAYLARHPGDAHILLDRARCRRRAGRLLGAERDFVRAGRIGHDPRAFAFAGYLASHQGRARQAHAYFARALALHPGYLPALDGLRQLR